MWGLWAILNWPGPFAIGPAGFAVDGVTVCGEQICPLHWGLAETESLLGQFKMLLQLVLCGLVLTEDLECGVGLSSSSFAPCSPQLVWSVVFFQ